VLLNDVERRGPCKRPGSITGIWIGRFAAEGFRSRPLGRTLKRIVTAPDPCRLGQTIS